MNLPLIVLVLTALLTTTTPYVAAEITATASVDGPNGGGPMSGPPPP